MTKGIEIKAFENDEEEKLEDEEIEFEDNLEDEKEAQQDQTMECQEEEETAADNSGKHKSGFTKQYLNYMID